MTEPDDLTTERRVLRALLEQRGQLEARLAAIAAAIVLVEARIAALEGAPDAA